MVRQSLHYTEKDVSIKNPDAVVRARVSGEDASRVEFPKANIARLGSFRAGVPHEISNDGFRVDDTRKLGPFRVGVPDDISNDGFLVDDTRKLGSLSVRASDKISDGGFGKESVRKDLLFKFLGIVRKIVKFGRDSVPFALEAGVKHYHPAAYNCLMKEFGWAGNVGEVFRLFSEMKASRLEPNVLCYNTLLNSLVTANCIEKAWDVFGEMISSNVFPNISTFNIMVKGCSWYLGQFDLA
ncbi:hypothetical protein MRB53_027603 [Persea americana]|uniref:Uncharacterized protein n=1 Tax=Persea americana TaxID=3435 RepID=A0ACC2LLK1_PERAE|nr:hypothetical protein MRB53_027603 [Persea americana]